MVDTILRELTATADAQEAELSSLQFQQHSAPHSEQQYYMLPLTSLLDFNNKIWTTNYKKSCDMFLSEELEIHELLDNNYLSGGSGGI